MKLEQQVCSPELAKKLKELRVKQISHFVWSKKIDHEDWTLGTVWNGAMYEEYSAFTVAELGELLGDRMQSGYNEGRGYFCNWKDAEQQWAETEADVRAKMLVYLLENKFLKDRQSRLRAD